MQCVVNYQATSKPRATGSCGGARSVYSPASNGTNVDQPEAPARAAILSSRCVDWRFSNPWFCWLPLDTVEPRPCIRSCRRRARRSRRHRLPQLYNCRKVWSSALGSKRSLPRNSLLCTLFPRESLGNKPRVITQNFPISWSGGLIW